MSMTVGSISSGKRLCGKRTQLLQAADRPRPSPTEFGYANADKGTVLAAFFAGYMCLQIPGGWLARRFGGWAVLGTGLVLSSLTVLLTPWAASSLHALVALRVLTGLGQSALYPTTHALVSHWAPGSERSFFVSLAWSGGYLGPASAQCLGQLFPVFSPRRPSTPPAQAVANLASGVIIAEAENGGSWETPWVGWRGVFFVWGIAGLAFAGLWLVVGASSPEQHSWGVSGTERVHVASTRERVSERTSAVPWRRLLLHPAVLAMVVAQTCHNWSLYLLLSWMPEFLRQQLHLDVRLIGFAAVAPFLACFAMSLVAGVAADACIHRGVRTVVVRKAMHTLSQLVPALALVAAGFVPGPAAVVTMLTISVGVSGAAGAGFGANHLDVAPQHASITLAVANSVASLSGVLAPLVVGAIVNPPHDDLAHWRAAFAVSAAVSVCGWAVFLAFGEGARLPELDDPPPGGREPPPPEVPPSPLPPFERGGGGECEEVPPAAEDGEGEGIALVARSVRAGAAGRQGA